MSDQPTQSHPRVSEERLTELEKNVQDTSASPPQQVQGADILPATDVEVPETASDEEKSVQDPDDRPDYNNEKSPELLESGQQNAEGTDASDS